MADRSNGVSGPDMARNVEGCGYKLHLELIKDMVTQDDDSFDEWRGFELHCEHVLIPVMLDGA